VVVVFMLCQTAGRAETHHRFHPGGREI